MSKIYISRVVIVVRKKIVSVEIVQVDCMPEAPLSETGEIGVDVHNINEYKFYETYGIDGQNKVEVEQNNYENNDTSIGPAVDVGNIWSRTSNLHLWSVKEKKKTSLVWHYFEWLKRTIKVQCKVYQAIFEHKIGVIIMGQGTWLES